MKSFDEYIQARDEALLEAKENEVLQEAAGAFSTLVGTELKKYIKVPVKIPAPTDKGSHSVEVKPDGIHGALCKDYTIEIRFGKVSDKENGEYYAVDFHLRWNYKAGGSNGKGICTVWATEAGEIIGSRQYN